jgi:hypothetical protein
MPPNQTLPPNKTAGKQADGWELSAINMTRKGWVQKIKLSLWDLFRYQYFESYQRRSLVSVR